MEFGQNVSYLAPQTSPQGGVHAVVNKVERCLKNYAGSRVKYATEAQTV